MNFKWLGLVVGVCSCVAPSTGGGGGGGSDAFVRPRGAAPNPAFVVCVAAAAKGIFITPKKLLKARRELNASKVTDGEVTVTASEGDCLLVRHTLAAGVAIKTELLLLAEPASVTDPRTGEVWYYAKETRRGSWTLNADHTVEIGGVDAEADGFDEVQSELTFEQGVFKGRVISVFDNTSRQLKVRRTTLKTGPNAVEHREETFVAGILDSTTTTTSELVWKDSNAPCFTRPLAKEEISEQLRTQIEEELGTALAEGVDCLEKIGGKALSSKLQMMRDFLQFQPIELRGFSGGNAAAGNNTGAVKPGVTLVVDVNTGLYTEAGCMDANERKGTLFHELLHSVLGPHAYEREFANNLAGPNGDGLMNKYVDVVASCEAACFGMASKTKCACARCLRAIDPTAKVCDERCKGFADCQVTDPANPLKFVMGPAVGAVFVEADKKGTYYKTMADCRLAHATGCKSHSLSCKKDSE